MFKFALKSKIVIIVVTVFLTGCSESADHLNDESDNSKIVIQNDADIVESHQDELEKSENQR